MQQGAYTWTLMHFIPSIATSMGGNERAPSLSVQNIDQEKEKYFLYNPIRSVDSFIYVLTS